MTESVVSEIAMFPLGAVLVPTMTLPLHIFEPRYRQLTKDCLAADREFGVCMIERGSEVGGGETRTNVGTIARIADASESEDGRWMLVTIGTRRIRVTEWLEDSPYPRALVTDWPDPTPGPTAPSLAERATIALRNVLNVAKDLGAHLAAPDIALDPDLVTASYQITAVAPISDFDRHRALGAGSVEARFELLDAELREVALMLERQIGGDIGGD